jgi:pyruvate dehydrogenase E1 component alpha subunit/2-oxoisovalerate dehydrogenase E1 component alpha subunit
VARARETAARAVDLLQVLRPDGSWDAALDPELDPALLRRMHRTMVLLRALDERMLALQRQGRVGFYGACTGQEAAVVGSAAALTPTDWVFPALREGAAMLWRGYPLTTYVSQVFGNALDPLKGRQMPSHMSDRRVNQVSWSSCIGSQLPQAVGAAWAVKLRGQPTVVMAYLGDGATSSADFHYAINFAGVYRVPMVLFCQNNGWSISVPTREQTASESIAVKALGYGVPGYRVDGNDLVAVHVVTRHAVERARRGKGPSFIEAVTYRIGAHSSSDDPTRYRDEAEVSLWRQRDPLLRLAHYLDARGIVALADQEAVRAEVDAEVRAAIAEAEAVGPPPLPSLFEDVYAQVPWHLAEERDDHVRYRSSARAPEP